MAFGVNSKVFAQVILDALGNTAAFDLDTDVPKVALYGNSGTPDNTVAAASSAYNTGQWTTSNEVSNGGWAAGGIALSSTTWQKASNVCTYDAADTANGTAATVANVYGVLVYDDTLTTPVADQGLCYNYLGGPQSVTAGTLTVVWNASGIFALTLT